MPDFVAFTSYGNDSLALLQLIREYRLPEQRKVIALYSDTGWASPEWSERVEKAEAFVRSIGIEPHRTTSPGFETLVRDRKMFPNGRAQFCTSILKILPAQEWLKANDPECRAICMNGVRRAESQRRKDTPVFVPLSGAHGNRSLWSPLAEFSDEDRNALIERTGFEILPHRSHECNPCIYASRKDLRTVPGERVDTIRTMESDLGNRTMYRPKAYAGASGIDEVMQWARAERGQFKGSAFVPKETPDDTDEADCDSGFCGG